MKATGIVRRIDELGRVVIPKEIRRTMRIREGDPLEIFTSREGEVIFKKYSLLGSLEAFASELCESLGRHGSFGAAITDRDTIIALTGEGRRELLGRRISPELEQILEGRGIYRRTQDAPPLSVSESTDRYTAAVAAPILCAGDVLGSVLFYSADDQLPAEAEYRLTQTIADFLGRHMET